jgi:hypothetical protein
MSSIVQETTVQNRYKLEVPELFNYPAQKNIRVLQACAAAIETRTVDVKQSGTSDFRFETSMGKDQFLSTAMKVHMSIPFRLTLKTWPTDATPVKIDLEILILLKSFR